MAGPSLADRVRETPVTMGLALVCVAVTLVSLRSPETRIGLIERFAADISTVYLSGQVWRLVSTTLLHVDLVHLIFNALSLVYLGEILERRFGGVRVVALSVLLALCSSAAQLAGLSFGIGFSGVLYGWLGVIMVGRKHEPALAEALPERVVEFALFWLLFCVVLSFTGQLPIGNLAHFGGLAVGWLVGRVVWEAEVARRRLFLVLTIGLSLMILVSPPLVVMAMGVLGVGQ